MEDGKVMNKLNVLYEDNHVIVVEKPINILSQSDATGDVSLYEMVQSYIKEKYQKPGNVYLGLVHRLDRPVGGVMVFARTSKAAARLSKQIQNHEMKKKYLAIVCGKLESLSGTFSDCLKRLDDGNTIVSPDGKKAELSYQVLSYHDGKSLVEISLKTGRHHQIRVQFASRGHYLLGDQRYGTMDKTQIALFAYYLSFVHPTTKEILTFTLDMPNYGHWTEFTM